MEGLCELPALLVARAHDTRRLTRLCALAALAACSLDSRSVSVGMPAPSSDQNSGSGSQNSEGTAAASAAPPSVSSSSEAVGGSGMLARPANGTPGSGGSPGASNTGAVRPEPLSLDQLLARFVPGSTGFVIHGNEGPFIGQGGSDSGANVGKSVAGGGDVNGDGVPDLLIGAPSYGATSDTTTPGAAFVVYTQRDQGHVDLNQVPANVPGLLLRGNTSIGQVGRYLANAGDVNGDGLDDVLVGAVRLDTGDLPSTGPGVAMVVFGSSAGRIVDLAQIMNGTGEGFLIDGDGLVRRTQIDDADMHPLAAAGDVNGDGLGDILVGAPQGDRVYVVFGKTSFTPVLTGQLDQGVGGYAYAPDVAEAWGLGASVAVLGDVNGDGISDFAFGAPNYSENRLVARSQGGVRIAWGLPRSDATVTLGPDTGFAIDGVEQYDAVGKTLAAVGDMNGDGLADLLINQTRYQPNSSPGGAVYAVFGKRDGATVDLSAVESNGEGGFVIQRASVLPITDSGRLGDALASIGDIDGDGRGDALIADPGREIVYVLFGKADGSPLLAGATTQMRVLMQVPIPQSPDSPETIGSALSHVGDVNGDGRGDYLIGAASTSVDGRPSSGAAYLVYGPGVTR